MTETELWRWYFGEQLGVAVPADLERYAREQGFAHLANCAGPSSVKPCMRAPAPP